MNDRDLIERLRSAEWPSPSPDLRARVAATPLQPQAIVWSDRVWYSRTWRLGMAAALMSLVALDYWAAPGPGSIPAPATGGAAEAQIEDLVRSVGLPDDAAASIARRTRVGSRTPAIDRASLISGEDR